MKGGSKNGRQCSWTRGEMKRRERISVSGGFEAVRHGGSGSNVEESKEAKCKVEARRNKRSKTDAGESYIRASQQAGLYTIRNALYSTSDCPRTTRLSVNI
jgi:hypothetical protein